MSSGSSPLRTDQLLLLAAAALLAAPAIAVGCNSTGARAGSAATGTGGTSATSSSTGTTTHTSTGTGGTHPTTTSSSGTGKAGLTDAGGTGGGTTTTGSGGAAPDAGDAGDAAVETTTTLHPGGTPLPGQTTCEVVEVTNIPEPNFNHFIPCTPLTYATNPPSGGDHWYIWGAYKIYTQVVPRELYVHDLEHGAIVLTYNCAGSCPAVVAALTQVFDSMVDPECLTLMAGPLARMVITPDPLLATPIAASAWGATYTSTCIDIPSLQAFANAHYNHGREDFCTDGQDIESDPLCPPDAGDGG